MKYSREDAHRRLYALAVKMLERHNPCGECPIQSCKLPVFHRRWTPSKIWCCSGCKYSSPQGCTVEALGCRLHLCGEGATAHTRKYVRDRLATLKRVAESYNLWYARASMDDVLVLEQPQDFWSLYHETRT